MKAKWGYTKNKIGLKRIYLSILPTIRKVARKSGYAIGLHGSLTRDMDIIAVPWTEKCVKPATLAWRISKAVCQYRFTNAFHWKNVKKVTTRKPHRRVAFAIVIGRHAYIDLSVIKPFYKK